MNGRGPLAVALVLAAALAGCADDQGVTSETVAGTTASTSAVAHAGTIAGIVVDDSYQPVAGADVYLQNDPNRSAKTDPQGAFRLAGLEPGTRSVVASMLGYLPATKRVAVGAGDVVEGIEIVLVPVAIPDQPYTVDYIGEGFISCSANAVGASLTFTQACGADPNNKPTFRFEVDVSQGFTALVAELVWTPTFPGTAQELRLGVWKGVTCEASRCDAEKTYGYQTGPSPVRWERGTVAEPFVEDLNLAKPEVLYAVSLIPPVKEVPAGPDDVKVWVVLQQPVTHYVTAFYNDEPPPGHTGIPA